MKEVKKRIRCAIYTRKSTEEGLEMEYNTLDAQRDAAEAYILSQRHEGWTLVVDHYDDGGFSGGNMERPALKRLMADIQNNLIDIVVVYKIDRLTRSLMDFAQLVTVFDQHSVSFVSVTQQFNTTTSMGRLTLNILLSFAQFEREVTGERIRDKVSASKRKGMWMGGHPPLGYDVANRKLAINKEEAEIIKHIFSRFITLKSMTNLANELRQKGVRTKTFTTQKGELRQGSLVSKGYIYRILNNAVYVGDMPHKGAVYPGQHDAIISRDIWNEAHSIFQISPRVRGHASRCKQPAILRGLAACGGCQSTMSPCGTRKKGKAYNYYAASKYLTLKCADCPLGRIPAAELERVVFEQIKPLIQSPNMVAKTWLAAKKLDANMTEQDVTEALQNLEALWPELFPAEQRRILELLLERVDDLIVHPEIKTAYERYLDGLFLRQGQARGSFEYAGIVFEEYRGKVGTVDYADANKANFFPVGVPGLFRQYNAPADFVETANTIGLPRYAKQAVDQEFGRWVKLHTQSNPLPICTRPRTLVKAKRT